MCFAFNFAQIGDRNGELTAKMNVEQLMEALGVNESDLSPSSSEFEMQGHTEVFFCLLGALVVPKHENCSCCRPISIRSIVIYSFNLTIIINALTVVKFKIVQNTILNKKK